MKKFMRENRNIKVGRDIIYLCSRIEKAKDILRQKLRKEPTLSELSAFLEIDEYKIAEALQMNNHVKSIDEPINDEGKELTIKDVVSNRENYDKLDLMCLRDELSKLSSKDKEILEKRYFEDLTQCETAAMMGISQVDVSRTERKLILSLRKKIQ
jgi:RNA polymerase sporulation-specific sigma factor